MQPCLFDMRIHLRIRQRFTFAQDNALKQNDACKSATTEDNIVYCNTTLQLSSTKHENLAGTA